MVKLKRAYEPPSGADGYRVLVERLWPRGVRKEALPLDAWEKEIAPSTALRKWFAHDPERWSEFKRRYHAELEEGPQSELLRALAERAAAAPLTLIFSSHDVDHNNAVVLRDELERRARRLARAAHRATRAPHARKHRQPEAQAAEQQRGRERHG